LVNYYATAKGANSPESDQSDIATIKGLHSAKPIAERPENNYQSANSAETLNNINVNIFPNPFNPATSISYYIPENGNVQIALYNIAGQQIAELVNEYQYPGEYAVIFDGQSLAGGVYFILLRFKNQQMSRKILMLK